MVSLSKGVERSRCMFKVRGSRVQDSSLRVWGVSLAKLQELLSERDRDPQQRRAYADVEGEWGGE